MSFLWKSSKLHAKGRGGNVLMVKRIPKYFVLQMGGFTLMKAGRYTVQILYANQTYFGRPKKRSLDRYLIKGRRTHGCNTRLGRRSTFEVNSR